MINKFDQKELAYMFAHLPTSLTKLAEIDRVTTIELLRAWGFCSKPLWEIWIEANNLLNKNPSIHIPKNEIIVKEDPEGNGVIEEIYNDGQLLTTIKGERPIASTGELARHMQKAFFKALREPMLMLAQLPTKIADLSYKDDEKALKILFDWGNGKKTIRKLWSEVEDALVQYGE